MALVSAVAIAPDAHLLITPRDLEILRWVARHGVVTTAQVQRRFFAGAWAAYRRVRALLGAGLLRRDPTFWKEAQVLRVTPAGARLADVGLAPAGLVLAEVRRTLAVVDLAERLRARYGGAVVVTERELRSARMRRWREERRRPPDGRLPAAAVRLPTGGQLAVWLDLAPLQAREIARVVDAYRRQHSARPGEETYCGLLWFVAPEWAARARAGVEAARAADCIVVEEWPHDDTRA